MPELEFQEEKQPKNITKRDLKRTVNRLLSGVFLYELLMFAIAIIYIIIKVIWLCVTSSVNISSDNLNEQLINQFSTSGSFYLVTIFIGIPLLFLFYRKLDLKRKIFAVNQKMTTKHFFLLLCVFMSVQCLFSILGSGVEAGLNQLGYSILGELESSSSISTTVSMFLYASIFGPITEEIIFRGFLLKGLQKYGNIFAITVSSIVFGAFHGNLIQSVFATFVGLVLGYVATEYSIKWSIALHIINNFVFGDLLGHLIAGFSDSTQSIITNCIEAGFFIAAVIILILKRKYIRQYLRCQRTKEGYFRYAFTSVWMIIFLVVQLLMAISGVEKL